MSATTAKMRGPARLIATYTLRVYAVGIRDSLEADPREALEATGAQLLTVAEGDLVGDDRDRTWLDRAQVTLEIDVEA